MRAFSKTSVWKASSSKQAKYPPASDRWGHQDLVLSTPPKLAMLTTTTEVSTNGWGKTLFLRTSSCSHRSNNIDSN